MSELILPFKPFTVQEVHRIIGNDPRVSQVLDRWIGDPMEEGDDRNTLVLKIGHDGFTRGLEYMGCFAAFAAYRWLTEGAGYERSDWVAKYISRLPVPAFDAAIRAGNTFPCLVFNENGQETGMMIPPPKKPLAQRLNMKVLHDEFKSRLERIYGPDGTKGG